jgi:hypothetical protein
LVALSIHGTSMQMRLTLNRAGALRRWLKKLALPASASLVIGLSTLMHGLVQ